MFREITRKKQQISTSECIKLLIEEKRGVLSVLGDNGYPYGMPMNHYYNNDDGCIYFHCGKEGHRIDSVKRCDKASFCVYDKGTKNKNGWSYIFKSVIAFGKIEIVNNPDTTADISRLLSRKFTCDDGYIEEEIKNYLNNTILLKLTPENICGKIVDEA